MGYISFKGTRLDPKALFTAKDKSKTRISVINFSGLPADDAKQSFVNRLEVALFSWIKQNPTPSGGPLTGLLVMDEAQNFAPFAQALDRRVIVSEGLKESEGELGRVECLLGESRNSLFDLDRVITSSLQRFSEGDPDTQVRK